MACGYAITDANSGSARYLRGGTLCPGCEDHRCRRQLSGDEPQPPLRSCQLLGHRV